ncbi:MAG: Cu-processing system ATP-binding protein [Candidatus Latescibacterota bacterium]|jgi:Cu-processing system ATP-binding protein
MELCCLDGVYMRYGREEVLRGVSLSVERGSILGLIGENGSGKSTLLKILAGILRPNNGQLLARDGRPHVGYMPENCQWYPYLSGAQVLGYFARYSGASEERQAETLERVGLEAARDKKVGAYSKGMKQKLGLAQAIIGDPDLLVLDEPTNGLDPRGISKFYEILQERAQSGAAIVLSSHLLAEIEGRITHAAFLRQGKIASSGPCAELMHAAGLMSRVILRQVIGAAALGDSARARSWQVQESDGGLDIILEREQVGHLLQLVSEPSIEVGDIEVHHASLDDLYLHMSADPSGFSANGKVGVRAQSPGENA